MLARSIPLQKEFVWGIYVIEALLLFIALIIVVRSLVATVSPASPPTVEIQTAPAIQEETLLTQAQDRFRKRDYAGGIALLDVAIDLIPTPRADFYGIRALIYNRLDNFSLAAADYQQAIVLAPNNAYYHTGLCYAAAQQNDFGTAIPSCDTAVHLKPQDWIVWNDRCYLRAYHSGDYAGAIADCNQALLLNNSHPYPYNNRGRAYLILGNYTEAIADASRSLALKNPYAAMPYTTRATAYLALGNLAQAQADYQAALDMDPTYPELHLRLGAFFRQQGQTANARQSFCTYLELSAQPIRYAIERSDELGGCP